MAGWLVRVHLCLGIAVFLIIMRFDIPRSLGIACMRLADR